MPIIRKKNRFKVGDKVKFVKILSFDPEEWFMTNEEFDVVKDYLDKVGTVTSIEKRYSKDRIDYFLNVTFSSGYRLNRVNSIGFEKFDLDFDWI